MRFFSLISILLNLAAPAAYGDSFKQPFFDLFPGLNAERVNSDESRRECKGFDNTEKVPGFNLLYACDAGGYGQASRAERLYPRYILNPKKAATKPAYYNRYVAQTILLARALAEQTLQKRAPEWSAEEKTAFTRGFLTLLAQENQFLHFRYGVKDPGILKFHVGDRHKESSFLRYDARGMGQININSHTVNSDVLFDLVKNIAYSAHYYLSMWQSARVLPCVREIPSGAYKAELLALVAYSGYNGGAGARCRSVSKATQYASLHNFAHGEDSNLHRADRGFLQQYFSFNEPGVRQSAWRRDLNTQTLVDYAAILNGADFVAPRRGENLDARQHRVAYLETGELCAVEKNASGFANGVRLTCLDESAQACLAPTLRAEISAGRYAYVHSQDLMSEPSVQIESADRGTLCTKNVAGLYAVGSIIRLKKNNVVLRNDEGEDTKVRVPIGVYQVLDFQVQETAQGRVERRYKIAVAGRFGFVSGGQSGVPPQDPGHFAQWTSLAQPSEIQLANASILLPRPGSVLNLTPTWNSSGSNVAIYQERSGQMTFVQSLTTPTRIQVKSLRIQGPALQVYATFNDSNGQEYAAYLGDAGPTATLGKNFHLESL